MTDPLVSVIITSYNHDKYLQAAFDSVFKQTWKNIEVIVVDDASTDNSINIINKIKKKHKIKAIMRAENYYSQSTKKGEKPIIEAMNMAKGKYISIVDSDDLIAPTKIAHQVNILEKNPHCSMCYSAVHVMNIDGTVIPYNNLFINGNAFDQLLVWGNMTLYIGSLIRRESYLNIERSDPDLVQEDWDMFLKLSKQGDFISSERVVAYYRRHENNTWYRNDKKELMYRNRMMILDQWKHEPKWVEAMNARWKQYSEETHTLNKSDIDSLLVSRTGDALLHFQCVLLAIKANDIVKLRYHIVQAIIYCDPRISYYPYLYNIALKCIKDDKVIGLLLNRLKVKSPPLYSKLIKKEFA